MTFTSEEDVKTVSVMVTDDTTLEMPESFFGNLVISPDSMDIAQVSVAQVTVNVSDNDCKFINLADMRGDWLVYLNM